ncbi:MAG: ComF family protein [Candidatus Omnitrophota bacterium]
MFTILKKTKSILKAAIDILMPPICYVCGESCKSKYGLCRECLQKILYIPGPFCHGCGKHIAESGTLCAECLGRDFLVKKAWSCCYYMDTIKECIHLFKYSGYIGMADIFGDIMTDFARKNLAGEKIDLIVPVPSYPTKKRERTYNHAEVLARSLSKRLLIPIDAKNLKKLKWSQSQSELGREKRLKNVSGTFLVVDKNRFIRQNVLLIDDVYTTGATIDECARTLVNAKAKNVFSLTLARGMLNSSSLKKDPVKSR